MSKRVADRIAEGNRRYEQGALLRGERFRLVSDAGFGPSFVCFATLVEAEQQLAEVERRNTRPIPDDYYLRQSSLKKLTLWLEEHDGKSWLFITGTHRECVTGIVYAD